jgi:hypothetical protein
VRDHASSFPGGRVPDNPTELAVLAIKVYDVFLRPPGTAAEPGSARSATDVANAIVDESKWFDAAGSSHGMLG